MESIPPLPPPPRYFHSKVTGLLVVFLGYKILILVFRVFWKILYRNEILVFFRGYLFSISEQK